MTPLTNSGMTVIDSVEIVMVRSRRLSRRSPANTPSRMDVGTMMTRANSARSSELPRAFITVANTGTPLSADSPQSPVTKLPAQVR